MGIADDLGEVVLVAVRGGGVAVGGWGRNVCSWRCARVGKSYSKQRELGTIVHLLRHVCDTCAALDVLLLRRCFVGRAALRQDPKQPFDVSVVGVPCCASAIAIREVEPCSSSKQLHAQRSCVVCALWRRKLGTRAPDQRCSHPHT